ncbi:MAG: hypothetical protein ACRD0Q_04065 [Acidimicrobiales bacterium]
MTERDPLDQALDLLVYAPVGLALSAKELLPQLADRGRRQVGPTMTAARMVGEMVVQHAPKEAERVAREVGRQGGRLLGEGLASLVRMAATGTASTAAGTAADPRPEARESRPPGDPVAGPGSSAPPPKSPDAGGGRTPGSAGDLAIPGYDSLSASQVVARLEGLTAQELEQIQGYEEAHRGRRTVLTRVGQLRSSA